VVILVQEISLMTSALIKSKTIINCMPEIQSNEITDKQIYNKHLVNKLLIIVRRPIHRAYIYNIIIH